MSNLVIRSCDHLSIHLFIQHSINVPLLLRLHHALGRPHMGLYSLSQNTIEGYINQTSGEKQSFSGKAPWGK